MYHYYGISSRLCCIKSIIKSGSTASNFNIVFTNIEEINQVTESWDINDFDNRILGGLDITTYDITMLQAEVTNEHQIVLNVDMKKH